MLAAHLKTNLYPVQLCALEELGGLQSLKQALLLQVLGMAVVKPVQHIHLEQLLVAHPHLDRIIGWAVLIEPAVDQRYIYRAACAARPVHHRIGIRHSVGMKKLLLTRPSMTTLPQALTQRERNCLHCFTVQQLVQQLAKHY